MNVLYYKTVFIFVSCGDIYINYTVLQYYQRNIITQSTIYIDFMQHIPLPIVSILILQDQ